MTGFAGATVDVRWIHTGHDFNSLAIHIHDFESAGALNIDFDFHCDVFDEPIRQRTIDHCLAVLDAFLQDPGRRIDEVSLLSARRARAHRLRAECHAGAVRDEPVPARVDRAGGRPHARGHRRGLRGRVALLRRAGAARQPPGPLADRPGRRSRPAGGRQSVRVRSNWSSACWRSSRPAGPTCRWTRRTRRPVWPTWSPTAGCRWC